MCAVGTVGNSVCLLWLLQGTVVVCCGYCKELCVCAVGNVGKSVCVLWYSRDELLCAVGTVGNSACVLCVLKGAVCVCCV